MPTKLIEIDGSYGEGGGQILRTACALAAVMEKPCHIFNIRKNRPKPGLKPQHLLGFRALAQFSSGKLVGDKINSEEIWFYPGDISQAPCQINVEIKTAGSITLVLQTLLLPALFSGKSVTISFDGGATDTFFSPIIDYFQYVFLEILEKLFESQDKRVEIDILRRGYYPVGGAKVEVKITPASLKKLILAERGKPEEILIISGAFESLRSRNVAERQAKSSEQILTKLKVPLEKRIQYYSTSCPGSNICIIGRFKNTVIGMDNLGKRGKSAEEVGREAAVKFLKEWESGASLDRFAADQIIPYTSLAAGESKYTISQSTNHLKTNLWVIEKFI